MNPEPRGGIKLFSNWEVMIRKANLISPSAEDHLMHVNTPYEMPTGPRHPQKAKMKPSGCQTRKPPLYNYALRTSQ